MCDGKCTSYINDDYDDEDDDDENENQCSQTKNIANCCPNECSGHGLCDLEIEQCTYDAFYVGKQCKLSISSVMMIAAVLGIPTVGLIAIAVILGYLVKGKYRILFSYII